ncbi:hypothetical protein F5Y09DRAFT_298271 [Xylaria sp. FL1042]|nr:hypothetical protein F5Y09DRAFT_298271 [Xylaria sp. FL1042]
MGSLPPAVHYPDASDETLVLSHATAAEQEQTWTLNHREWGGPLDLPAYLKREPFLASTPLAADGGMMHWILTDEKDAVSSSTTTAHPRRVLASCETIRKRVLYVPRGGDDVREGLGYGIGSVYTYPEFRGKKYAARMLRELGVVLKRWPGEEQWLRKKRSQKQGLGNGVSDNSEVTNGNHVVGSPEQVNGQTTKLDNTEPGEAVCSALWSDIGKRFYASKGWPVYASEHVEFPSSSPSSPPGVSSLLERSSQPHGTALTLAPVNTSNIAPLCHEDETQLRAELLRHARETGRTAFAFAPDPDVFRWHWAREGFIASHVFPGRAASEVRGLIATVGSPSTEIPGEANGAKAEEKTTRMWAIWTRNYGADAATNAAKNTLYILRLVIDNSNNSGGSGSTTTTTTDPKALQLAFDAILHGALDAARAWHCGSVHLWNPTPAVRDLIAGSGVAHRFVNRELDSIPSMMWYGSDDDAGKAGKKEEGEGEGVDWIANEKYCWC